MDNRNKKKSGKAAFLELLSGIAGRLFGNESKGEAAIFVAALLTSAASMVLDIIAAISSGRAWGIVYALTVGVVFFLFVPLLTVSDRFYLFRGRSMILIAYSAACVVLSVTGFIGASGVSLALAILGLMSALALYGTLIYDQLVDGDHPIKYWLIYCGALYRILFSLVMLIIDGAGAGSVVGTLAGIFGGLASVSVLLMLLYLFDGFSFAKYMYFEIIDAGGGDEVYDDEGKEAGAAGGDGAGLTVSVDEADPAAARQPVESVPGETADDIPDEAEYIPYAEDDREEYEGEAEEPGADEAEPGETELGEDEPEEVELWGAEPEEAETEEAEPEEAEPEEVKPEESEPDEADTDAAGPDEPEPQITSPAGSKPSAAGIPGGISPVELKYVRFASAHKKPDETPRVTGMSGDLFDVWVDGDTLCFLNDLGQAVDGRGIRSAVIPFGDVSGIRFDRLSDGAECVVLTYMKSDETREIRFTKESFVNFKRVMEAAGGEG